MNYSQSLRAKLVLAVVCVVLGGGCDWLLGLDRDPPFCYLRSPADSSNVSGLVSLQADAVDSLGVRSVEFFVEGVMVGFDSSAPYEALWDTDGLADRSWHRIWAAAVDLAGNRGFSETLSVQIVRGNQRSVYHGTLTINNGSYASIHFSAGAGDTLAGELLVQVGNLTRFAWLDASNFEKFRAGQAHEAVEEQRNLSGLVLRRAVPAAGGYYLVFVNSEGSPRNVWVRFNLE